MDIEDFILRIFKHVSLFLGLVQLVPSIVLWWNWEYYLCPVSLSQYDGFGPNHLQFESVHRLRGGGKSGEMKLMFPTKVIEHTWTFVCNTLGRPDDLLSSISLLNNIFDSFGPLLVGGKPSKL